MRMENHTDFYLCGCLERKWSQQVLRSITFLEVTDFLKHGYATLLAKESNQAD